MSTRAAKLHCGYRWRASNSSVFYFWYGFVFYKSFYCFSCTSPSFPMLALQLVIIEICVACCPPLGHVFDTGYYARHCTHTKANWILTVSLLCISVFWLAQRQCGCCGHCSSHPHSCGQLLGHGGPLPLTIVHTPALSITPKCCIRAL